MLVFFCFLCLGEFLAFTSWLPTLWLSRYASTLRSAGVLTAAFSLLSALIRVARGLRSDRISLRYTLPGNFLLMFVGTLVLSFSGTFAVSLMATPGLAAGMDVQIAIVFKLLLATRRTPWAAPVDGSVAWAHWAHWAHWAGS
jgi:NNP family nitrate/nitrite transporter-like MFS transporter